jgi:DNA-binding NarL/FixJ family response regulator
MQFLIIDDHALLKEGIEAQIKTIIPEAVCHFTTEIRIARAWLVSKKIEIVFCDLEFRNNEVADGFYLIKEAKKINPAIKGIALTNYNSYRIMKKVMKSGFDSFLEKGGSFEDFSDTLLNVIEKGKYCSPVMKQLMKKREVFLEHLFKESLYGISFLSPRERELTLLAAETTQRQILAKKMKLSPSTIDTYFKTILSKLGLRSREELALFSIEFKNEILKYNKEEE